MERRLEPGKRSCVFEIAPSDWTRVHDFVAKSDKLANGKNLGHEISNVVVGVHMLSVQDVLVTENTNPFLACVDVLELAFESRILDESLSRGVVHFQFDGLRERKPHLIHDVAEMQNVIGGIGSTIDLGCTRAGVGVSFANVGVCESNGADFGSPKHRRKGLILHHDT